jgi:hypothetical protein
MRSWEFDITAILVVNAETQEEAEQHLREGLNSNGELFNITATGHELPKGIDFSGRAIYENFEVNFK